MGVQLKKYLNRAIIETKMAMAQVPKLAKKLPKRGRRENKNSPYWLGLLFIGIFPSWVKKAPMFGKERFAPDQNIGAVIFRRIKNASP